MACVISVSRFPDDTWIIQNRIFSEFADLVITRFSDDEDVVSQVQLAEAMNGASLHLLYEEQPELALRLRNAFQTVAKEIGQGTCAFPEKLNATPEVRSLFADLDKLLARFHPGGIEAPTDE